MYFMNINIYLSESVTELFNKLSIINIDKDKDKE